MANKNLSQIVFPGDATVYDLKDKSAVASISSSGKQLIYEDREGVPYYVDHPGIFAVKGTQAASTNEWTGNLDLPALYDGLTIAYYLPWAGTSSQATLQLTLSDNSTTAKVPVYYTGNTRMTTHAAAGSTIILTYWGADSVSVSGTAQPAGWRRTDYNTNDNTISTTYLRYVNNLLSTRTDLYRYQLLLTEYGNTGYVIPINTNSNITATTKTTITTATFDPFAPIYYYSNPTTVVHGAAIPAGDLWYGHPDLDFRYSFNTGSSLSVSKNVYLVAIPQPGGGAKLRNPGATGANAAATATGPDAGPITQTLPSSEDGFIYIKIGQPYSPSRIALTIDHPIYWFKNGAIREWDSLYDSQMEEMSNLLAANDAMTFKGTLGQGGTLPALPANHKVGDTYKVAVADVYAGYNCEVGDLIICIADGTVNSNADWTIVQNNIDGAVIGPSSATNGNFALFDGTTGKIIKNSNYSPSSFAAAGHNHNSEYKPLQTAVADADATAGTGTATTFVSSVEQDANGVISVTKQAMPTYNNYTHPTGNGYKHIPADGALNQYLKYSAAGTAQWATISTSDISGYSSGVTSLTIKTTSPLSGGSNTATTTTGSYTLSLADGYGDTKNPYASKTKNYVLAAPSDAAGVPTFRALVAADIPALTLSKITDAPDLAAIEALSGTSGFLKKTAANTWTLDTNSYVTSSGVTSITIKTTSPLSGGSDTATTSTGTYTLSLANGYGDTKNPYASKTKNYVLAAPDDSNGAPVFRALVAADIPSLTLSKISDATDLAAIEALTDTSGFLKKTAADTWALENSLLYIASYGSSTYDDVLAAYKENRVIYCRASSNSNPASGNQLRMAFLAYVGGNTTTPTSFEFQYYRSVNNHTSTQQGDQVFVYTLSSNNSWSVVTREAYTKINVGSGLSSSYTTGTSASISIDHPTGDGNLHVPATGTDNSGKFLMAGATAGSLSWETIYLPTAGGDTNYVLLGQGTTEAPQWTEPKTAMYALINSLTTGTTANAANDYLITQYVNGGTSNTNYYRRKASDVRVGGLTTARTLSISGTAGGTAPTFNGTANATLSVPATMTGFTSITSTAFVGDLTGNASTAASLNHSLTFGNGTYVFDGSDDVTVPVYDGSWS